MRKYSFKIYIDEYNYIDLLPNNQLLISNNLAVEIVDIDLGKRNSVFNLGGPAEIKILHNGHIATIKFIGQSFRRIIEIYS